MAAAKDSLVIHTSTWNLGNTLPEEEGISPVKTVDDGPHWETFLHLVDRKLMKEEEEERDLVVFAFQEIDRFIPILEGGVEPWTQRLTEEMTADSR